MKNGSGKAPRKLVWIIILSTLMVAVIIVVAGKLLPSFMERLFEVLKEKVSFIPEMEPRGEGGMLT